MTGHKPISELPGYTDLKRRLRDARCWHKNGDITKWFGLRSTDTDKAADAIEALEKERDSVDHPGLTATRNAALEEAAKVADGFIGCEPISERIRSLKQ